MSSAAVEPFDDVARWAARRPNGTASTAITIALDGPSRLPGPPDEPPRPTATMTATAAAAGHRVAMTSSAIDLSAFDDLVLWVRGTRRAEGTPTAPFFAEVRLGSAALAVGAAGNTWSRLVPITNPGAWEYVPLSLADLAPAARSAVTEVRMTSLDATTGWTLHVDSILAVREEVLADTDAALHDLLDQRIIVGATTLPAVMVPTATPPSPPYVRILNIGFRPLPAAAGNVTRTDYAGNGFALRRGSVPAELTYQLDVVTDERSIAAPAMGRLLDAVLTHDLVVTAGKPCRLELVDVDATAAATTTAIAAAITAAAPAPAAQAAAPPIQVRVFSYVTRPGGRQPAVPPFQAVAVEVDHAS